MDTKQSSTNGYILRIGSEDLANRVFTTDRYYSGAIRDFHRGTPILFAAKVGPLGDSIIGYAVVEKAENLWEMITEEESYAKSNGWRIGLTLRGTTRLHSPLPLDESPLKEDKRRGAFLHGAKLTEVQVDALLEQAEERQRGE